MSSPVSFTATYRLQLHAGFTFDDAAARVPYLAVLGVSHLYLSPILQAAAGSTHGYDVVDHTRVSADLGGEAGLARLHDAARAHDMGIVVDVVPNHMALVAPESANRPLWHVLRDGRAAATEHWFDIDWAAGGDKLCLPILGDTIEATIAAGDITLDSLDGRPVLRYFEHVFPVAPGTVDLTADAAAANTPDLAALLDRQHYQLASWRERDTVLNYRRFFEVDELIAVRVEEPDVFAATHELLLRLNHDGIIDGFRIDHPDGLADPEGYLDQLHAAVRAGTLVWVEKILEGDEQLPDGWRCAGTTGYDALLAVQSALVDPAAADVLARTWDSTGGDYSLHDAVNRAKREAVEYLLAPERARLLARALETLGGSYHDDPGAAQRLSDAIAELLVAGEVYRAYAHPGREQSPDAQRRLDEAVARAVAARPDLEPELEDLRALATPGAGDGNAHAPALADARAHAAENDFAVRLQQTWGPVMAKGIEDTTFYRWHELVALNEVGSDPELLRRHAGTDTLHTWAAHQQRTWPRGMTTLSTHDTKRSEDVRARLIALAGDADGWEACSAIFADAADAADVDRPTAHLLWQTLAGAGFPATERLHAYLLKAVREAKSHTNWIDGDADYEARVLALADAARTEGRLRDTLEAVIADNREPIRATVLTVKLLQLCLPGVPDTYQGCEVVDLSLVDPDNRRPIDFTARAGRLQRIDLLLPDDLDGEKLLVTSRALRLRRADPAAFGADATYAPLDTTSEHAVGFVRSGRVACVGTRAPRRLAADGGWGSAVAALPTGIWHDVLTGQDHVVGASTDTGTDVDANSSPDATPDAPHANIALARLLAQRPVALLTLTGAAPTLDELT